MTKQEKIQEKWQEAGFIWDEIKDIVNEYGGLQLKRPYLKDSITGYSEASKKGILKGYDFDGYGLKVWNSLLNGIENNNGWTKIENPDDLPKEAGMYLFKTKGGRNCEMYHDIDVRHSATHWRPIVQILDPIY